MSASTPHRPSCELARRLRQDLVLPVVVAPMFVVSGPDLVVASCSAGVIGSISLHNARTVQQLEAWLAKIGCEARGVWAASMIVHDRYDRFARELELMHQYRPNFVVTTLGSPKRVLDEIHAYGGAVFADVASLEHARNAADAGADGLVLGCGAPGDDTAALSPFGFIDEVRRFFDGPLIVAGAISSGHGVRTAEDLGADLVYMGPRFIASPQRAASMSTFGAGQGVGLTTAIAGVRATVDELVAEYHAALSVVGGAERIDLPIGGSAFTRAGSGVAARGAYG